MNPADQLFITVRRLIVQTIIILPLFLSVTEARWMKHGKREAIPDKSTPLTSIKDTLDAMRYLQSLRIELDTIFVENDLYHTGNISNKNVNYYKRGKLLSKKEAHSYQNGLIDRLCIFGSAIPIFGPAIVFQVYTKKEQPGLLNSICSEKPCFQQID